MKQIYITEKILKNTQDCYLSLIHKKTRDKYFSMKNIKKRSLKK